MSQNNTQSTKYRYAGFFVSLDEVLEAAEEVAPGARLEKVIADPHVTLEYRPQFVDESLFGLQIKIHAVGYANDGENEGFRVVLEIPDGFPLADQLQKILLPHITVSLAEGAAAVNTCNLSFEPCKQYTFTAVYGALDMDRIKHLCSEM